MAIDFKNSNYPLKLVSNIIDKVKSTSRDLTTTPCKDDTPTANPIRIISTFGVDKELCKVTESVSGFLPSKFQYVKKTGPTLKSMLCKSKHISTGNPKGRTTPCNRNKCQTCHFMSNLDHAISTDKKKFKTAAGSCTSKNIIYSTVCKLCTKPYVGKTTLMTCGRVCLHKSAYNRYRKLKGNIAGLNMEDMDDTFALSIHLYNEHGLDTDKAFEDNYKFTILEHCSPKTLPLREHIWIQRLQSLTPLGLNLNSPLGFPLLM